MGPLHITIVKPMIIVDLVRIVKTAAHEEMTANVTA